MHLPARQRGLALLVLLTLFATTAAYMLVSSLNQGSAAQSLARSDRNRAVMQEAKAALIAWSASETLQGASFQPGRLPCPDRDNNGNADSSCTTVASRLGRLPYRTLGIGELRDASGELLWYAVSNNFRTGAGVINSDTQGTLTISGLTPANNAVAVVLAPGSILGTQDRSPGGTLCNNNSQPCNTAANYLDGINSDGNYDDYVAAAKNLTDPVAANLFNDQLLVITPQDLFAVVEPMVAGWISNDIVGLYVYNSDLSLTDSSNQWSDNSSNRNRSRYFDAWGGFPFAAPFAKPDISTYTGVAGTLEGLLPVVGSLSYNWTSPSVVQTGGSGSISSNCAATTAIDLKCDITSSGSSSQPQFRMSGTVAGVSLSFVQLTRLSDVSTSGGAISSRSLSGSLDNAGAGIVMLDATMPWSDSGTTVTVTINNGNLITSPLISSTDPYAGWYTANQWHRLTYYAVSPGYAPGGGGSCSPTGSPRCLAVNNLANAPNNDKRAILILAGSSLNGNPRPSAPVTDYLEGQNATTAQNIVTGNYTFQTLLGTVSSFSMALNDRVIVVAP
ncbi:MAG: hypothetical protein A3F75_03110 [Betaproteobacteria bacterium RIFCSPLOWO2_12_FULL_64_23]|nr:MAG: hypothetical protein A3F75_03110 [Betaproteobacteria bacterium RIFCSPLOWO2_12_FULL_64_23]